MGSADAVDDSALGEHGDIPYSETYEKPGSDLLEMGSKMSPLIQYKIYIIGTFSNFTQNKTKNKS